MACWRDPGGGGRGGVSEVCHHVTRLAGFGLAKVSVADTFGPKGNLYCLFWVSGVRIFVWILCLG